MFPLLQRLLLPRTRDQGVFTLMVLMLFFWSMFDEIMSFVAPLIIAEHGITGTMLGIVIGSCAVAGALFDFVLSHFLPYTNFRKIFLVVLLLSFTFPFVLLMGSAAWVFVIAMAIWALYYNLYRVSTYDFVSRRPADEERSTNFGVIQAFVALGYLLAPFIVVTLMGTRVGTAPFVAAYFILGIAAYLYLLVLGATHPLPQYHSVKKRIHIGLVREFRLWRTLGKTLRPVLVLSLLINIIFAFYMTLAPFMTERLSNLGIGAGLFIASEMLPMLFVGFFVGNLTKRFGKKRTAIVALVCASLTMVALGFVQDHVFFLLTNLVAFFFVSVAIPSLNAAYADYITEARGIAVEIEFIEDMSSNFGYIIGPILAGVASQFLGLQAAFSLLGICALIVALYVFAIAPDNIFVNKIKR